MNDLYCATIIEMAPKVLSQIDRDPDSLTYGCCDRNHWHLKTRDFASAILQQSGLAALLLGQVDFPGNPYYNHKELVEWAKATLYYWVKIQLKDGSFNEYYPNEHGFPPTAFSLYSACEIYKRTGMQDESILKALGKTGRYLCNHIEKQALNQEIASITALYSLYTIIGEEWALNGLNNKLETILKKQSVDGWFSEYGGADIGYLSVSLDFLAEYYEMSHDTCVIEPLHKVIDFIKYFIHPNGTIGGEYASRNTTYFLPNGPEILSSMGDPSAEAIVQHLFFGNNHFLRGVDDRYWSHYLLHSFLRAAQRRYASDSAGRPNKSELPFEQKTSHFFADAGLYIYSTKRLYAIAGLRKGGVIKVFKDGKEAYSDYGYRIKYAEGHMATTNWQDSAYKISAGSDRLSIDGNFNLIGQKVPSPVLHTGLRVVSKLMGNRIISVLKGKIILVDKHSKDTFERFIDMNDDSIVIEDVIKTPEKRTISTAGNFSLRHVASGKFYSVSDLALHPETVYTEKSQLHLRRTVDFSGDEVLISEEVFE